MDKKNIQVYVKVNLNDQFEKFVELLGEARELYDLIPDHNKIYASTHFKKLTDLATELVIIDPN